MAKIKLKRPGSSLDHSSNTDPGGPTSVYPSYLDAPRTQSARLDAMDDANYIRNKSLNIPVKDTVHARVNSLDGSSYKKVVKRGSEAASGEPLPASLRGGRSAYLTEDTDKDAVKNWTSGGRRSTATRAKRKK